MIDCIHWKDCGMQGAGCCSQGLYGGKPSHGVCQLICKLGINVKVVEPVKIVAEPSPQKPQERKGCGCSRAKRES